MLFIIIIQPNMTSGEWGACIVFCRVWTGLERNHWKDNKGNPLYYTRWMTNYSQSPTPYPVINEANRSDIDVDDICLGLLPDQPDRLQMAPVSCSDFKARPLCTLSCECNSVIE